jgi:KaiC/GvpD/RAD55 family RecA-like ATPase
MPDAVNEVVVIAAALVDHEARKKLVASVHPDAFFADGHPAIWEVVVELERRGLAYDPATARQLSGGKVDADYLDQIVRDRPEAPPNLWHHVDVLRWDHARIDAIRGPVTDFLEALRDPQADPERVRQLARRSSSAFEHAGPLRYMRDPAALTAKQMADIRARRQGLAVYPFGIEGFDRYADNDAKQPGAYRMIPGTKPGQITLITGTSGSGKTTLTARVGLAQEAMGRRVHYGAWEQGDGPTLEMLAGMSLGIPKGRLQVGDISDAEELSIEEEMNRLQERVRFFGLPFDRSKDEKKWTNMRRLDVIQDYVEAWGAGGGVVILDLFRYALTETDPDEEDRALTRLRAMCEETQCHFILVHQQRLKDLEAREDKQPTREGIKGSSAWVDVVDTIIGVHREFLFKAVPDDVLRLLVLKQRNGVWPLAVDCDWDPQLGLISNGRSVDGFRVGGQKGAVDEFLEGGGGAWHGRGGAGRGEKPRRKREGQR